MDSIYTMCHEPSWWFLLWILFVDYPACRLLKLHAEYSHSSAQKCICKNGLLKRYTGTLMGLLPAISIRRKTWYMVAVCSSQHVSVLSTVGIGQYNRILGIGVSQFFTLMCNWDSSSSWRREWDNAIHFFDGMAGRALVDHHPRLVGRCKMDSHPNTCVAGNNCVVLEQTRDLFDIMPHCLLMIRSSPPTLFSTTSRWWEGGWLKWG